MTRYSYYHLDGIPRRVTENGNAPGNAEMYKPGHGFVPGPAMEIEFEGIPLSKGAFDALILALIAEGREQD